MMRFPTAPRVAAVVALAALLAWQAAPPGDTTVAVGTPTVITLDPALPHPADVGSATTCRIVPAQDGALTVSAASAHGDVLVRRLADSGAPLEEFDGGGVDTLGWDARFVIDAVAGQPVRLLVAFREALSAPVTLEVVAGRVPPPEGPALREAQGEFYERRGDVLREAGKDGEAMRCLIDSGKAFLDAGGLARATRVLEPGLALAVKLDNPRLQAMARVYLGTARFFSGDRGEALELLEQGLVGSREFRDLAGITMMATGLIAEIHADRGELEPALEEAEAALEMARAIGDEGNQAVYLSQIASIRRALGDHAGARQAHDEAIAISESLHVDSNLAHQLARKADFHRARQELREEERLRKRILALHPDSRLEAQTLGELATIHRRTGQLVEALEEAGEALRIVQDLADAALEIKARAQLGITLADLGDDRAARESLQQALSLLGDDGDPAVRATTLLQLLDVQIRLGDMEAAKASAQQLEAIQPGRPGDTVQSDIEWGMLTFHVAIGDEEAALENAQRRIQIAQVRGDEFSQAVARGDLAGLQLRRHHTAFARDEACAAVESLEALGITNLDVLSTLADAELELGHDEAAEFALADALAYADRTASWSLDIEDASLLRATESMARLADLQQDVVAARLAALPTLPAEAGSDERAALEVQRASLIERGLLDSGRSRGRALLAGIAEHRRGARSPEAVELRKARDRALADHQAQRSRISRAVRNGAPSTELAALHAEASAALDEARRAETELRRIAPREAALDAPEAIGSASLRQEILGKDAILIEFAAGRTRLRAYVLTPAGLELKDLGDRDELERHVGDYVAMISDLNKICAPAIMAAAGRRLYEELLAPLLPPLATTRGELVIVPSASVADLSFDALVTDDSPMATHYFELAWVKKKYEITYEPSTAVLALLQQQPARLPEGRALVLVDPLSPVEEQAPASPVVADAKDEAGELVVSAGEASSAPETVPSSTPTGVPRIGGLPRLFGSKDEGMTVSRLFIEVGLPTAAAAAGAAPAPAAGASTISQPRGGTAADALPSISTTDVPPAPAAASPPAATDNAAVSDALAQLEALRTERSGTLDAGRLRLALGSKATPAELSGDLHAYSVIHIAAHGLIDMTDPRRSGLALSSTPERDGFLSIADVLDLDLDADLVVLSACDTARGAVRRGEGVQSLARAFMYSGARSVVATLWPVDDRETQQMMEPFYRGFLNEGLAPAAALQRARLALCSGEAPPGTLGDPRGEPIPGLVPPERKPKPPADLAGHPYFWAPFVFIGPAR